MTETYSHHLTVKAYLYNPPMVLVAAFFAWLPGFPISLLAAHLVSSVFSLKAPLSFIISFAIVIGPLIGLALLYKLTRKVCNKTTYILGDNTISETSGLFSTTTRSFKYSDIVSMSAQQSIGQKKAGLGTINIQTASESNIKLWYLPDYIDVFTFINDKRN